MTDSGPGSTEDGASGRDDPRWSSSLSNSSLGPIDEAGDEPPNPFSREGARASEAIGVDASIGSATAPSSPPPVEPTQIPSADERWPSYPPVGDPYAAAPDPYTAATDPYGRPYPAAPPPGAAAPPPGPAPASAPGYDPLPTPPYGYGAENPGYNDPAPASYGGNPYAVNPYQPAYGAYSPYGAVAVNHPQATLAMVLGIISIVLASSCGIGGFLGIAGIVQGRKVRNEIDARPGTYTGRSMASAGIITGTIGVVLGSLVIVFLVFAGILGAYS